MTSIQTGLRVVTTVFGYFSPAKSPHYSTVVFGTISLVLSAAVSDQTYWLVVAAPILAVLALSWVLAVRARPKFSAEEHEDQLKFSRSMGISSASLVLVTTGVAVQQDGLSFYLNYLTSITQMLIFLLYSYVRKEKEELPASTNLVQLALISIVLLAGASTSLALYRGQDGTSSIMLIVRATLYPQTPDARFLATAIALYVLWSFCTVFWAKYLTRLIEFIRIRG